MSSLLTQTAGDGLNGSRSRGVDRYRALVMMAQRKAGGQSPDRDAGRNRHDRMTPQEVPGLIGLVFQRGAA
jgi:hypothetical protein